MEQCACGKNLIAPVGPEKSDVLIIGEYPDFEEVKFGAPFSGKRGDILRKELISAGVDIRQCRVTYLTRHELKDKEKHCEGHVGEAAREMRNHPYVLLVGAGTMSAFGIDNPSGYCGLQVRHFLFPENCFVMGCLNPPQSSAIGEFRLAITKFAKRIQEDKNGGK